MLDAKFHVELESRLINLMETPIANKLESAIDKAIQRGGFDKSKKTIDLELVIASGEVRQVGEKLIGFQSAMADEFSNFRSRLTDEFVIQFCGNRTSRY